MIAQGQSPFNLAKSRKSQIRKW